MAGITVVVGLIGLTAGALIGCVGVGGVIVVPALVYGLGFPIQDAIASAMIGYVFTGGMGTAIYARSRSIRWGLAGWIALGAAPGALLGAWAINFVEPRILECGVGALSLLSGLAATLIAAAGPFDRLLADRGYDANAVRALIAARGALE